MVALGSTKHHNLVVEISTTWHTQSVGFENQGSRVCPMIVLISPSNNLSFPSDFFHIPSLWRCFHCKMVRFGTFRRSWWFLSRLFHHSVIFHFWFQVSLAFDSVCEGARSSQLLRWGGGSPGCESVSWRTMSQYKDPNSGSLIISWSMPPDSLWGSLWKQQRIWHETTNVKKLFTAVLLCFLITSASLLGVVVFHYCIIIAFGDWPIAVAVIAIAALLAVVVPHCLPTVSFGVMGHDFSARFRCCWQCCSSLNCLSRAPGEVAVLPSHIC